MARLGPFEENTIVVGDCLDIMAQMPDGCVDLVVTDPPYGVNYDYGEAYNDTRNGYGEFVNKVLVEYRRISAMVLWTPGIRNEHLYPKKTWTLCWLKGGSATRTPLGFCSWEPIFYWGPSRVMDYTDVIKVLLQTNRDPLAEFHPCPKPAVLWRELVRRFSNEGDLIFDPFIGSGTTAVVADRLGRKFFGCDINPDYVEMALKRLEKDRAGRQLELCLK